MLVYGYSWQSYISGVPIWRSKNPQSSHQCAENPLSDMVFGIVLGSQPACLNPVYFI